MLEYAFRRLLLAAATLLGITLVTFVVVRLAPGDPAALQSLGIESPEVSVRTYEDLRAYYGLDRPVLEQYGRWLWRVVTGDLGNSFHDGERVSAKIGRALLPTAGVALASLAISLLLALPIGVLSAARHGGWFDRLASSALYLLYSVPAYVMGMVLILLVSVKLDLLPFRGMRSDNHDQLGAFAKLADLARHSILITACFAYTSVAYFARFVRHNLLEVLRQDYIRTARAKGLGERRVLLRHALANTLIPFVTLLGLTMPALLSGSVILETMFNWPGLGSLYVESVFQRDYPTIMALNCATALLVLGGTLLADLAYGVVDPRVRHA